MFSLRGMSRVGIRGYKVLAIETSCDDTAVSIVCRDRGVLAEFVASQHALHASKGGIVPYLAAEAHRKTLPRIVGLTLKQAALQIHDIDVWCATRGPGIAGCLTVGYDAGKLLAAATSRPFLAIHHMEGHALIPRMTNKVEFPFLCLLISGGHTILMLAKAVGDYTQLGTTLDDSVGEAIDKASRMIGVSYDAITGPAAILAEWAAKGNLVPEVRISAPKSKIINSSLNFSFSGLKTGFRDLVDGLGPRVKHDPQLAWDLARSFLNSCADHILDRIKRAAKLIPAEVKHIAIAGGAARNKYLISRILEGLKDTRFSPALPCPSHCTDNATMIAWAAMEYLDRGIRLREFESVKQDWPMQDIKLDVLTFPHEKRKIDIL